MEATQARWDEAVKMGRAAYRKGIRAAAQDMDFCASLQEGRVGYNSDTLDRLTAWNRGWATEHNASTPVNLT